MKVVFKVRKVVKKTVFLRSGSPVRVLWFFLSNLTFFDLILYHFIIGKIGPKVSHLLTARVEGANFYTCFYLFSKWITDAELAREIKKVKVVKLDKVCIQSVHYHTTTTTTLSAGPIMSSELTANKRLCEPPIVTM